MIDSKKHCNDILLKKVLGEFVKINDKLRLSYILTRNVESKDGEWKGIVARVNVEMISNVSFLNLLNKL